MDTTLISSATALGGGHLLEWPSSDHPGMRPVNTTPWLAGRRHVEQIL